MIPNSDAVRQLTELGFLLVTATENPAAAESDPPKRTASELYPTQERATHHRRPSIGAPCGTSAGYGRMD